MRSWCARRCAECESFTTLSIDSLLVYENKYYLQVYLDNGGYKVAEKQMTDYFDDNLFETYKDCLFLILINVFYKLCIIIELK